MHCFVSTGICRHPWAHSCCCFSLCISGIDTERYLHRLDTGTLLLLSLLPYTTFPTCCCCSCGCFSFSSSFFFFPSVLKSSIGASTFYWASDWEGGRVGRPCLVVMNKNYLCTFSSKRSYSPLPPSGRNGARSIFRAWTSSSPEEW